MQDDHGDRRASERRKLFRIATITYAGSGWPVPCVLLDISPDGARLALPTQSVPDDLHLVVEREAISRPCRVVWRKGEEVGVRFTD